jgi:predicted NUDIX family NTP pyrophosphohydrolase
MSEDGIVEVFIVHPGGPYWAKKDDGAWSVAKGEYEPGDDPLEAARREFGEEIGTQPPTGPTLDLGEIRQPSGKRVSVWAVEALSFEVAQVVSNDVDVEWPPRSGRTERFPEVDRAGWFPVPEARRKLLKGQAGFLDRLTGALVETGRTVSDSGDHPGR